MPQPKDRDAFKAQMAQAAEAHVAHLPDMFAELQQLFRDFDPVGLLASVAYYGLQRGIGDDGSTAPVSADFEQHQFELLQAVLLTLPRDEWASKPSLPEAIDRVFKDVPKLSMAFLSQRILAGKEIEDIQQRTIAALQERVRFHTHAVRNWGYFGDVVAIAKSIYAPLDKQFLAYHGFAASDVVELAAAMVNELERRANVWSDAMRRVAKARTIPEMARRYYEAFGDLSGSPEGLIKGIPKEASLRRVFAMLMAHADLRHPDNATFEPTDLASLTGIEVGRVERALTSLALLPGALRDQKLDFLFLSNPVWEAPVIKLGEQFFTPMPQAVMSHIHAILRRLAAEADLLPALDSARNAYLERTLGEALRQALPMASIGTGVAWNYGGQRFETDAIAQVDKTLLIVEAKAHHLTPEGLRGAPDRIRRHVKNMVIEPSLQSDRLESIVRAAQAGSTEAVQAITEAGITKPDEIEKIIRLSVSLDDLSVLASAEQELRDAGWVPKDHVLAPMMNIADLLAVADILDQPVAFLHYLSERGHFQRSFNLIGDELDFLGFYLDTGFNLGELPGDVSFIPSGMSEPIDRYYDARDAGLSVQKPVPKTSRYFASILSALAERRPPGWTLIGMHLLNSADAGEQARLGKLLEKARKAVRRKAKGAEQGVVVSVQPRLERKATVVFYVHDQADRKALKLSIENLAAENLENGECVVVARHGAKWEEPYQIVGLAKAVP